MIIINVENGAASYLCGNSDSLFQACLHETQVLKSERKGFI